jgi:hypothetical protein
MKAIIAAVLTTLPFFCFSQKPPIKYGDISPSDLQMVVYDKDSSASAVVLSDYGHAYIQISTGNATLNFERHVRIKILKKEGLSWADASIQLYHSGSSEEKLTQLKASTYNLENGKIIESKMSKDGSFKEKFDRNYNIRKFTLPNVKEGSVIEYSYTIISEFFTNFPNWRFQRSIPTRHSEYWAVIPEFFVYEKYMQGYVSVTDYKILNKNSIDFQQQAHHWVVKDVPAFKEEPFMTNEEDYISKINFALSHITLPNRPVQEVMGSWNKLNELLLEDENFGKAITGSGHLKKIVEEITAGISDPLKKISIIHNYVKQNIEWDGAKDYSAASFKKILEVRKGSSGDINLLLASMLDKAGFEVEGVILSTRDHGFIRKLYPMHRQFNYVVCLVRLPDNKNIWLDATEKFLPINVLPPTCLNGEGLIISKKNHGWINLDCNIKDRTVTNAELTLATNGELKGKLNLVHDGYDAQRMRKMFTQKGEQDYLKDFLGTKEWQIEKSDFADISDINKPSKELHELTINDHASVLGELVYINPFISSQILNNPFTLNLRTYPVDFGNRIEKIYMFKLNLPEGYTVDEIPQSRLITLPGNSGRYSYNITQLGNAINVTSTFQINKNIFSQEEYPNLREFYALVIAKQAEQIVLKKK